MEITGKTLGISFMKIHGNTVRLQRWLYIIPSIKALLL